MTCSSAPEYIVADALEGTFLALRRCHLRRRIRVTHRGEVLDDAAVLGEVGIDLDEHGFYPRIAYGVTAAGQHFVLETVDVDLDVVRHRDDAALDQPVERARDAALGNADGPLC